MIQPKKINKLAGTFKLLSEPNRLKILFALQEESRSVSEIKKLTNLSQPLVSFHLKALREAGLVKKNRKSTFVFNKLADDELIKLINQFSKYGSDNSKKSSSLPCPPWKNE